MGNKDSEGSVVEQIYREKIVYDYDQKYSPTKLRELLAWYFHVDKDTLQGEYENCKFQIHAKNITYLGKPWEKYKKRIQLWSNFSEMIQADYDNDFIPLVIGVYHYKRTVVFVDFEVDDYLDNATNNSAAHVQTYDLQRAIKQGIYSKVDKNGNHITAFSPDQVEKFLRDKLAIQQEKSPLDCINDVFNDFYISIPSQWEGIECYKYLVEAGHPKQRETEWPGFFHEALFEKYIEEHKEQASIVRFQQNKAKGDLDFDLYYPQIACFGDLKCHTIGEPSIPGNKIENLYEAIKRGPLYYVICEHTTEKDSGPEYRTLTYWNNYVREKKKRGTDVEAQKGRMKAKVVLIDYIIIQIDEFNCDLLESFQKGFMNSNNTPRGEKFSIPEKLIEEFIVRKDFVVNRGILPSDFPVDSQIKECIINALQEGEQGKSTEEIIVDIVCQLSLSTECQHVTINKNSKELLLNLVVERMLFQLKKQGKIKQTRKAGIRRYLLQESEKR